MKASLLFQMCSVIWGFTLGLNVANLINHNYSLYYSTLVILDVVLIVLYTYLTIKCRNEEVKEEYEKKHNTAPPVTT